MPLLPSVPADDIEGAYSLIEQEGCVLLEDAIPSDDAGQLAELVFGSPTRAPGVKGYDAGLNETPAWVEYGFSGGDC